MSSRPLPPSLDDLRARGPVALFLDFDGTLVDIAPTPDAIDVPGGLASALADLATQHGGALAVVSGRSLEDLKHHLGALRVAVAGSHGAEIRGASGEGIGPKPAMLGQGTQQAIRDFADAHDGVEVESKTFGLALHYRAAPERRAEVEGFARELADQQGLQIKAGKAVCELMMGGGGKDRAVGILMNSAPFAGAHPVFIGDDITDEDGFVEAARHGGTTILVGEREGSAAQFGLADPAAVRDWLGL